MPSSNVRPDAPGQTTMKLLRFEDPQAAGGAAWGVAVGAAADRVLPLVHGPHEGFERLLERAAVAASSTPATTVPLASLRLLPPLPDDACLYCIGLNYDAHVNEAGRQRPANPSVFLRRMGSIVGSGRTLQYPGDHPAGSTHYDFEGELAVVIGRRGRHVDAAGALALVAGYTVFNDGSARDFQQHSVGAGKNFEASGSCGPWLVSADDVADIGRSMLTTRINDVQVQHAAIGTMLFPITTLIAYVSRFAALKPGDLIATGTPAGVGATRTPPLWLKPGDHIGIEIDGIGRLDNTVGVQPPTQETA